MKPYADRRTELIAQMHATGGGVAIIPTAPEALRNNDADYPYRHDSYFYYLSGFTEPEAVIVLIAGKTNQSILFCREKNLEREIWDGYRYGPEAAREKYGFDAAYPYGELDARLPDLIANQDVLHTPVGADPAWDLRVAGGLNHARARVRAGVHA